MSTHRSSRWSALRPPAGLLTRYWRGFVPLPHSFWLGFVLPGLVAMGVLGWVATSLQVTGAWPRAAAWGLLLGWPLAGLLVLGGAVGAWRAARRRLATRAHRGRAWGWPAVGVVATGVGLVTASLLLDFLGQADDYLALALGRDPLGQATFTATPNGQRLRLSGVLGAGDAARVQAQLTAMPALRLLELDLQGGRVAQARLLAQAVAARGVQTRVVGTCDNACVLVYLAGQGRQVMPEGRLGLHRLAPVSSNPLFEALARRQHAAVYREAGLPERFITKLLATPATRRWHAEPDELLGAGLVGVAGRPLDVALPGPAGTPVADYMEALRSHALWQALDARHAGSTQAAAERMAAARDGGGDDDATQAAGQRVLEALLPRLLAEAGPGLWEPWEALLSDQLAAAAALGPAVCTGVLAGDASARRSLPQALQQREAEWLGEALSGPARDAAPRRPRPLEREVMGRALGGRGADGLASLLGPTRREVGCASARALLAEVAALPAGERNLARRFLFGPR